MGTAAFTGGRVADAGRPGDGGLRRVAVGGRALVVVRCGDERFACEDRCLHAGCGGAPWTTTC